MESRRSKGIRGEDLGSAVGLSKSSISKIENDEIKGGPEPETVVKIAEALGDRSILTTYLEQNPVYQSIIPKIFPDLNNIRRDPAIIFSRFASEAEEAVEAARILADIFSNAEPSSHPNFCEVLRANLEQIVDVQRCAEVLFLQLIAGGVIDETDRCEIHVQQQRKGELKGHHRADRTGTEG
jgi:transcriptional regulator with XRE-family HTH domain